MTRSGLGAFLVDLALALVALLAMEWVFHRSLGPLEALNAALNAPPPRVEAGLADFHAIGARDPLVFFAGVRVQLRPKVIVFVGDSQGLVVKDSRGLPYPQLAAQALSREPGGASVIALQLGGANAFEQGALLLGMLRAGIAPRAVFWFHSIFSLRKNEIRSELVPLYLSLPESDVGHPDVILVGGAPPPASAAVPPAQRLLRRLGSWLDRRLSASATLRFARLSLADKSEILRSSSFARLLLPSALRPRTAQTSDPPGSILEDDAAFVGRVTTALERRGVRVVNVLAPIRRDITPRPVSVRSESIAYPALERAVREAGGSFESWLDLLPDSCYGRFEDGSDDAFHVSGTGHRLIARRLLASPAAR